MTQEELIIQRLLKDVQLRAMQAETRRHFLKESAMGLGALAIGTLFGGCRGSSTSPPSILFDPAKPLLPKPPHFAGKAKSVIFFTWQGRHRSLNCLIINLSL